MPSVSMQFSPSVFQKLNVESEWEEFMFCMNVPHTIKTFLHINTLTIITIFLEVNKTIGFIRILYHFVICFITVGENLLILRFERLLTSG
jgi:hypothetical protein